MASPYRAIFAAPGSRTFSSAGFLGRLPLSMMGISVVTMVSQLTGRYGLAGALSATVALSSAVFSPQISRLVDRHGQRRVIRPTALITVTAVGGLVAAARGGAPDPLLFLFAAGAGSMPSVGSMVRARWAHLYREEPRLLHSAFAFESVVDESCFVFGPILAIGLSTAWFPEAGPLLAAGFLLVGVLWLSAQRATEPVPHPREQHSGGSALRTPGLQVLVAAFAFTGAIFGSVDVATVAFAEERGHKALASVTLAVYALGSVLAGAVFGLLRPAGPPARRWLVGVCAMAVSMIPLQLVGNLPSLAVALFIAGMTIAPTMVTTMALVEQLVPRAKLTEGMTWTSTGLAVGVALGSSAAGWAVDSLGAGRAYGVPAAAGALAALVAFLGYRRLSPRPVPRREGTVEDGRAADEQPGSNVA
ncbi:MULTISPECIES: MFS transporter [unclassified Streptomyces]|uniref:MFS transporter n=1 Tax=unclassified Streptomyces TaxID=2593676 RepID=UPI002DDC40AC|nr:MULTISPECIES: MFS transporter [unclassified Streptomyces]WSA91939.1 MFS transporter [Streptomyces sp. NBC_01795]WSS15418.1 MFS transporter [Streptomyces sp. NBC_01186]WSS44261.1 MFS transporter [Streptomyces sp. NBC_01187]